MCGEHDFEGIPIDLMRFFTFLREFLLPNVTFTTVREYIMEVRNREKEKKRMSFFSNYKKKGRKEKKRKTDPDVEGELQKCRRSSKP